jgi:hypothetical protein
MVTTLLVVVSIMPQLLRPSGKSLKYAAILQALNINHQKDILGIKLNPSLK